MACKNCGKKKEKHDLLYIMNPACGWCKRSDPVVQELVDAGYEITTLNLQDPSQAERANEAKSKHNARCGTPFFLDAETGNMICGFKPKEELEKWAKGEKIPAPPPRPNQQQPQQPQQPAIQLNKLEYIWLDGNENKGIRSKVKYLEINRTKIRSKDDLLKEMPEWSFDGSSTKQAAGEISDCVLKPVKVIPNSTDARGQMPSFIVLCEVYDHEGNPHKTNTRSRLREIAKESESHEMWFSIEQEYTLVDPVTYAPFGWDKFEDGAPGPQGDYYCGNGSSVAKGREIAEGHALSCVNSGIPIEGINAEVMLSQWEYQTKPKNPLDAADDLWVTRFLLQRLAERMGLSVSYDPKPVMGDWNGSGAHINFSTKYMREHADMGYMNLICASMEEHHKEAIEHYGVGNNRRLTGDHETSPIDKFSWGEMDRTASIRIPVTTVNNDGKGYLEDRRPAANVDPYEAFSHLLKVTNNINEELLIAT